MMDKSKGGIVSLWFVLSLCLVLQIGCQGNSNLTTPGLGDPPPNSEAVRDIRDPSTDVNPGNHKLLGLFGFEPLPDGQVKVVRFRQSEAHHDATKYLLPPNCDDCLSLTLHWSAYNSTLNVSACLRNPSSLTVHDVRGIFFFPDFEGWRLEQADGYTPLWQDLGYMPLNPYRRHMPYLENQVAPDEEVTCWHNIKCPSFGDISAIRFAVDISWPGPSKEPFRISGPGMPSINAGGGSFEWWIDVWDWGDDTASVTLDMTPVSPSVGTVDMELDGLYPDIHKQSYHVLKELPPGLSVGYHTIWVTVVSTDSDLYTYWREIIYVGQSDIPQSPRLATCLDSTTDGFRQVEAFESALYVLDWFSGVQIFDFSQPADPRFVRNIYLDTTAEPLNTKIYSLGCAGMDLSWPYLATINYSSNYEHSSYEYIYQELTALKVFNVSTNPLDPELEVTHLLTDFRGFKVFLHYPWAFVWGKVTLSGDYGFYLVDLTQPDYFEAVGPYICHSTDDASDAWLTGGLFYVLTKETGYHFWLRAYKPPDQVTELELLWEIRISDLYHNMYGIDTIMAHGGLLYILVDYASSDNKLVIADISEPASPEVISEIETQNHTSNLVLHLPYLYARSDVFDVSDPYNVVRYDAPYGSLEPWVIIPDPKLLIATQFSPEGAIQILEISDPLTPDMLGKYTRDSYHGSNMDLAISEDGLACVCFGYDYASVDKVRGLIFYDVSDPTNLSYTGFYQMSNPRQAIFSNDRLYVLHCSLDTTEVMVSIFNITDVPNLIYLGGATVEYGGWETHFMAVGDNYIVVNNSSPNAGMSLFDLSDPDSPEYKHFLAGEGTHMASEMFASGEYLYFVSFDGIGRYDLSDLDNIPLPEMTSFGYGESGRLVTDFNVLLGYPGLGSFFAYIYNFNDFPSEPVSYIGTIMTATKLYGVGSPYIYSYREASTYNFVVHDVSDPANPYILTAFRMPDWQVAHINDGNINLRDNYAYFTTRAIDLVAVKLW